MATTHFKRLRGRGFTLIELMVALAVVSIVLAIGVPSYRELLRSNRLTTMIYEFSASLNLARSEAIRRGVRVTVRKAGAQWESGWLVFTDYGGYGNFNSAEHDELLRQYDALTPGYTLRGNNNFANYVSFLADGSTNNMGSFVLCDDTEGTHIPVSGSAKLLIINNIGRTRLGVDSNGDGIPEKESSDGKMTDISSCTSP